MSIELRNISKKFGHFSALKDINLEIAEGELVALLGPSGCGKTTLLRIIAGLERPDSGHVMLNGVDKTSHHVSSRGIGFVFQHYALFRHMTVFDNVAFGLRVKPRRDRPSEAQIKQKVSSLLALVQLEWLGERFPDQLSGGQRQRIALARALAVEPEVLLLDEPFGALDASVRKDLRQWLRDLHQELHVTSIFVTHDQEEAMEVASQVVVLHNGNIEQQGSPADIYDYPRNAFVSKFIGQTNILSWRDLRREWLDEASLPGEQPGDGAVAHIRPHNISVEKAVSDIDTPLTIKDWQHLGAIIRIELRYPQLQAEHGSVIYAEMPTERFRELHLEKGDAVAVHIKHAQWFN